jgi:integrase
MTVYFNKKRRRWMYNVQVDTRRYNGYCLDAEGKPVTSRSAARQAEAVVRHRAEIEPKLARIGEITLAEVMDDLKPLWQRQAGWANRKRYMREVLEFFGPGAAVSSINEARIQDYVVFALNQFIMSWQGGPKRDPASEENQKFWRATTKKRQPDTVNLYLAVIRAVLERAGKLRDPVTGKLILEQVPVVRDLPTRKRRARPVPDSVIDDLWTLLPSHNVDAVVLTLFFGFRRSEVFSLQIHNVDFDARGIRLFAEHVKDEEDTFLPGVPEAMEYLEALVGQAKDRDTTYLITWRTEHKDPSKNGPWRPIKSPKRAWKRAMKIVEATFGRRFRWHDLRASFITHIAMTSGQLAAQALARHSDYATTQAYVEVADEMRRTAAERAINRPSLSALATAKR